MKDKTQDIVPKEKIVVPISEGIGFLYGEDNDLFPGEKPDSEIELEIEYVGDKEYGKRK